MENSKYSSFKDVLTKVLKFNKDRGLLAKGFDYDREAGFLMSESLELIKWQDMESALVTPENRYACDYAENHDEFASNLVGRYKIEGESDLDRQVKYVDTFIDQFIFGAGGCMKMGIPMGSIIEMMHIVCDANLQKTGGVTEDGKQKKGSAFKSPDEQIREILIQNNINMAKEK